MIDFKYSFLLIILIYLLNNLIIKNKLLLNTTGDIHQNLTSKKKIPLTGGIYIFLSFILFFNELSFLNKIIILSFYSLGFLSDIKFLKLPLLRLIFQVFIIFIFIFHNNLFLENTRVMFLDNILKYQIINFIFVIFCITIIINGTNFIDGVNCNVIGYYLIISIILYKFNLFNDPNFDLILIKNWILILFGVYILNFFNKLYLGDNGSYFLGFIFSYLLIYIYLNNQYLSPFFIILLLWYPAFENLFSLVRKLNFKKSPFKPDQNHLHQLLFFFLKRKKIFREKNLNSITGNIILIYNLPIFYLACLKPENTQHQILLISINILIYCITYLRLFRYKYKNLFQEK